MILDEIIDSEFVFRNSFKYAENKQIKVAVDAEEAPKEFFFIHIKYTGRRGRYWIRPGQRRSVNF